VMHKNLFIIKYLFGWHKNLFNQKKLKSVGKN